MLYLETSAPVKLYLDEPGRKAVTAAVSSEAVVATQETAYIEANAAFSTSAVQRPAGDQAMGSGEGKRI